MKHIIRNLLITTTLTIPMNYAAPSVAIEPIAAATKVEAPKAEIVVKSRDVIPVRCESSQMGHFLLGTHAWIMKLYTSQEANVPTRSSGTEASHSAWFRYATNAQADPKKVFNAVNSFSDWYHKATLCIAAINNPSAGLDETRVKALIELAKMINVEISKNPNENHTIRIMNFELLCAEYYLSNNSAKSEQISRLQLELSSYQDFSYIAELLKSNEKKPTLADDRYTVALQTLFQWGVKEISPYVTIHKSDVMDPPGVQNARTSSSALAAIHTPTVSSASSIPTNGDDPATSATPPRAASTNPTSIMTAYGDEAAADDYVPLHKLNLSAAAQPEVTLAAIASGLANNAAAPHSERFLAAAPAASEKPTSTVPTAVDNAVTAPRETPSPAAKAVEPPITSLTEKYAISNHLSDAISKAKILKSSSERSQHWLNFVAAPDTCYQDIQDLTARALKNSQNIKTTTTLAIAIFTAFAQRDDVIDLTVLTSIIIELKKFDATEAARSVQAKIDRLIASSEPAVADEAPEPAAAEAAALAVAEPQIDPQLNAIIQGAVNLATSEAKQSYWLNFVNNQETTFPLLQKLVDALQIFYNGERLEGAKTLCTVLYSEFALRDDVNELNTLANIASKLIDLNALRAEQVIQAKISHIRALNTPKSFPHLDTFIKGAIELTTQEDKQKYWTQFINHESTTPQNIIDVVHRKLGDSKTIDDCKHFIGFLYNEFALRDDIINLDVLDDFSIKLRALNATKAVQVIQAKVKHIRALNHPTILPQHLQNVIDGANFVAAEDLKAYRLNFVNNPTTRYKDIIDIVGWELGRSTNINERKETIAFLYFHFANRDDVNDRNILDRVAIELCALNFRGRAQAIQAKINRLTATAQPGITAETEQKAAAPTVVTLPAEAAATEAAISEAAADDEAPAVAKESRPRINLDDIITEANKPTPILLKEYLEDFINNKAPTNEEVKYVLDAISNKHKDGTRKTLLFWLYYQLAEKETVTDPAFLTQIIEKISELNLLLDYQKIKDKLNRLSAAAASSAVTKQMVDVNAARPHQPAHLANFVAEKK